jgi:hypothetical protein
MRKLNLLMASSAVGLVAMAGSVSIAPADTLTGGQLSGLNYSTGANCSAPPCSAAYSSSAAGGAGGAVLTSDDSVGVGGYTQFTDTATVAIPTSVGTLNNLISTGGVTYYDFSATAGGGQVAYWNIELQNPNDGLTATLNDGYGPNAHPGANPLNFATDLSTGGYDQNGTSVGVPFATPWATVETTSYDGLDLGLWTVTALTISVGGWNTNGTDNPADDQTDVISSITVPDVVTTPLPASVWLFAGGLGFMGLLGWRKKRKGEASVWPTQVAEGAALAA